MNSFESFSALGPESNEGLIDNSTQKKTKRDHYWHATISEGDGSVVESIKLRGLLPKSVHGEENGNHNTPDEEAVYVAETAKGALKYLKLAEGYNFNKGGVPILVAVDVYEKGPEHSFDTDVHAGLETEETAKQNRYMWETLISTYESIDEFLAENIPSFTGKKIQSSLEALRGKRVVDVVNEIREALESNDGSFLEGSRLKRFLESVDSSRWDAFLTKLHKDSPSDSLLDNMKKKGGWGSDEIRRIYAITPGGDTDWESWAGRIPPEYINRWDEWDVLPDMHGNPIGAKGKLVRIQ